MVPSGRQAHVQAGQAPGTGGPQLQAAPFLPCGEVGLTHTLTKNVSPVSLLLEMNF